MRTTLRDIAGRTGVSVTTVSLVLSGAPARIAPSTRARVIRAAREMEYRPRQAAAGVLETRTKTLGFLIPAPDNAFFAQLMTGAEEAAAGHGYGALFCCNPTGSAARDREAIHLLLSQGAEALGMVLSHESIGALARQCFEMLEIAQKPALLVDRSFAGTRLPSIGADQKRGGYLAAKYLLQSGHVRIGCITGPIRLHTAVMRLNGYRLALEEAGLAVHEDWIEYGDYSFESGEKRGAALLERGVSALFACNDLMAYGAMKAAADRGIAVPKELSIVGFDNIPFSALSSPPLTTVNQPARLMGRMAAEQLISMLEGRVGDARSALLSPQLVVRGSVARREPGG